MEDYLISIHHLRLIRNIIQGCIKDLNDRVTGEAKGDSIIFFGIKSYIIILAVSNMDEYDNYLIPNNADQEINNQIIKYKTWAKPAINRIRKWNGMEEFRNSVIAHNFRIDKEKKQSIFLHSTKVENLYTPDHVTELVLLEWCINVTTNIICQPFEDKLLETNNILFSNVKREPPRSIDYQEEIEAIKKKIHDSNPDITFTNAPIS